MIKEKDILIKDVLRTIAYFDVFNYPLTREQVYNFLPRNSVTKNDISIVLTEMVERKVISHYNDFYSLHRTDRNIDIERSENETRAQRLKKYAKFITRLLKRFPFVRGVFITGSLSKNLAAEDSDIDFMIITAPNRLWICKTVLTLFRKIILLGNRKYFCTNYYISEKQYQHQNRNQYSAIEIITTKVGWNTDAFKKYVNANAWTKDYLPNHGVEIEQSFVVNEKGSWFQKTLESILSFLPLKQIDSVLMMYFHRHWKKRYMNLSKEKRDSLFQTTPDISSVWKNDQQEIILNQYNKKLFDLELI
jgi:hypothetical protein